MKEDIAHMMDIRNEYKILVRKTERKEILERIRRR
jgi:hypothetical protein